MNIFVLDLDPVKAAQYHCDKHVVKMCVETAQLLCTAAYRSGAKLESLGYKPTHMHHPCTKWILESNQNYDWLCELGIALCNEYTFRYGKVHKSMEVILACTKIKPNLPSKGLTKFALAMPDECKVEDPVLAYRKYYNERKSHMLKYKNRTTPNWVIS